MKKIFPILEHLNVPNVITTLGMGFGVLACYFAAGNRLWHIMVCLFFASLMDVLDGYFAVKLKQQTLFGKYADSLADFFVCCIVPMLMAFTFMEHSVLLTVCVGAYMVSGMWRLANYNLTITEKKANFTGVPVPAAMFLTAATVWCVDKFKLPVWVCAVVFFIAAVLMVSPIKAKKYGAAQILVWLAGVAFFVWILFSYPRTV
jgi:CDP-diacylglycerol--serine O-phosphatidyltransferase